MPVVIVDSVRRGIATLADTAVIVVVYAPTADMFGHRTTGPGNVPALILESGITTGVAMPLIATALPCGLILRRGRADTAAVEAVVSVTRVLPLLLPRLLVRLVAGCFLDLNADSIIQVLVHGPVTRALAICSVAFGAITVVAPVIGLVTPATAASTFVVVLSIFLPGLASWLPMQMRG